LVCGYECAETLLTELARLRSAAVLMIAILAVPALVNRGRIGNMDVIGSFRLRKNDCRRDNVLSR